MTLSNSAFPGEAVGSSGPGDLTLRGRFAFLAAASRILSDSLDYEKTLVTVAGMALPHLGAWCIVDLLEPDGSIRRLAVLHPDPSKQAHARELSLNPPSATDACGVGRVMRTENPEVVLGSSAEFLRDSSDEPSVQEALRQLGSGVFVTAPMVARGRLLGAITFATTGSRQFDEPDVLLAEDLARRCAMAIDNSWLHTEALKARQGAEQAREEAQLHAREAVEVNEQLVLASIREQELLEESEAANRAKTEFLSNISHEIRTPMNAIVAYTDLLTLNPADTLSAKQELYVTRIRSSCAHLLSLIEDILDLAKVEGGSIAVREELTPASETLNRAVELLGSMAAKAGVDINMGECPDQLSYIGDPLRVRQILVNLISNAVKFTEPGGRVTVSCGAEPGNDPEGLSGSRNGWTVFTVEDTGIGIAEENLTAVFNPFIQVETGYSRRRGGAGLGLTIARELARRMNGNITLRSQKDVGSTFSLWLPAGGDRVVGIDSQ